MKKAFGYFKKTIQYLLIIIIGRLRKRKRLERCVFEAIAMGIPDDSVLGDKIISKKIVRKAEKEYEKSLQKAELPAVLQGDGIDPDSIKHIYTGVWSVGESVYKEFSNEWGFNKELAVANALLQSGFDYEYTHIIKVFEKEEGSREKAGILMEKLHGSTVLAIPHFESKSELFFQIGSMLGSFHVCAERSVPQETAGDFRLLWERKRILAMLLLFKPSAYRMMSQRFDELDEYYQTARSVCSHGDFHIGNIMAENGKVCGLLDFSDVKRDSPLRDIACFISSSSVFCDFSSVADTFLRSVFEFIKGYRSTAALSDKELEYLPLFIDIISFRTFTYFKMIGVDAIADMYYRNRMLLSEKLYPMLQHARFE